MGLDPVRGTADSGRLANDLAALFEVLGETARELGVGALVLIDEMQSEARSRGIVAVTRLYRTATCYAAGEPWPAPASPQSGGMGRRPESESRFTGPVWSRMQHRPP